MGVEEELLLVEPGTGRPLAVAERVLLTMDSGDGRPEGMPGDAGGPLESELQRQQLETSTKPCAELSELDGELWRGRAADRIEMLRLAAWRASRSGLDDVLLSPRTGLPEPALTVANTLLEHVRDALDEAGDTDAVTGLLGAVLARGNGAAFQRSACRDGGLPSVIESAAAITAR